MFSTKAQLQKRTPENGTDRENFISQLVDEYLFTSSYDAKCQVLANLANFAYDPFNYGYIREVGALDIFLHILKNESSDKLKHFSCAAICNLCVDPLNASYILTHSGLQPFISLLKSTSNLEIISNIITIFYYLYNKHTETEINRPDIIHFMNELRKSDDRRLANLAIIFLQDKCHIS